MSYKTQKEVDARFDESLDQSHIYEAAGKDRTLIVNYLKAYIQTVRTADLDAHIQHLRGKKKENIFPVTRKLSRTSSREMQRNAYNQAIDDHITYLESLKKGLA